MTTHAYILATLCFASLIVGCGSDNKPRTDKQDKRTKPVAVEATAVEQAAATDTETGTAYDKLVSKLGPEATDEQRDTYALAYFRELWINDLSKDLSPESNAAIAELLLAGDGDAQSFGLVSNAEKARRVAEAIMAEYHRIIDGYERAIDAAQRRVGEIRDRLELLVIARTRARNKREHDNITADINRVREGLANAQENLRTLRAELVERKGLKGDYLRRADAAADAALLALNQADEERARQEAEAKARIAQAKAEKREQELTAYATKPGRLTPEQFAALTPDERALAFRLAAREAPNASFRKIWEEVAAPRLINAQRAAALAAAEAAAAQAQQKAEEAITATTAGLGTLEDRVAALEKRVEAVEKRVSVQDEYIKTIMASLEEVEKLKNDIRLALTELTDMMEPAEEPVEEPMVP